MTVTSDTSGLSADVKISVRFIGILRAGSVHSRIFLQSPDGKVLFYTALCHNEDLKNLRVGRVYDLDRTQLSPASPVEIQLATTIMSTYLGEARA